MTVDDQDTAGNSGLSGDSKQLPAGTEAANLVRCAHKVALGTIDAASGHPYVSLIIIATLGDGAPVALLSGLARHAKNIGADNRASLLFEAVGADGDDPMAAARVTLIGTLSKTTSASARDRFLARHPEAEHYADFPDFSFYMFDLTSAHFIGGFGQIVELSPADILLPSNCRDVFADGEQQAVAGLNIEFGSLFADAAHAHRARLVRDSSWSVTGLDPGGFDLAGTPASNKNATQGASVGTFGVRANFESLTLDLEDAARAARCIIRSAKNTAPRS